MSLVIKYITNGTKKLYVVRDAASIENQITTYEGIEDIPLDIRHYATKLELKHFGPDMCWVHGVQSIFYPNFPDCGHPKFVGNRCIAESCKFAKNGDYTKCPYFPSTMNIVPSEAERERQ